VLADKGPAMQHTNLLAHSHARPLLCELLASRKCLYAKLSLKMFVCSRADDIPSQSFTLLQHYDWVYAMLWIQAAHLFWALWGLIQARFSSIDYDYIEFAHLRLVEYCARKTEFLSLKMPW